MNDRKRIETLLRESNWTLKSGTKHIHWICPCGNHVHSFGKGSSAKVHMHVAERKVRACKAILIVKKEQK